MYFLLLSIILCSQLDKYAVYLAVNYPYKILWQIEY